MKTWGKIKRIIKKLVLGECACFAVKLPKKSRVVSLAFLDFGRWGLSLYAFRKNRVLVTIGAR